MPNYPDLSDKGYQVEEELGQNPLIKSFTYKAKNIKTSKSVVIKQIHYALPQMLKENLGYAKSKINAFNQVNHSSIVPYLDCFKIFHSVCLVRGYVPNATSVDPHNNYNQKEIQKIGIAILEVLSTLQQRARPIVHRNIKPENILVKQGSNNDKQIYLVDFGFGSSDPSSTNSTNSTNSFTPGFAPLEYVSKGELNKSFDVYSLGVTLICLLAGIESNKIPDLLDSNYSFNLKKQFQKKKLNSRFMSCLEKMVAPKEQRYINAAVALKELKSIVAAQEGGQFDFLQNNLIKTTKKLVQPVGILVVLGLVGITIYQLPLLRVELIKDCPKCNLANTNWNNADLQFALLSRANLKEAQLKGTNLWGADLQKANLNNARLDSANLGGADLTEANLKNAKLSGANLGGVKLSDANLESAELSQANLDSANLSYTNLNNANLELANLSGANLLGAKLESVNLKGSILNEKTILDDRWILVWQIVNQGANNADLSGADLQSAYLADSNLESANLQDSILKSVNLKGSNLAKANLKNANLMDSNLEDADLSGADLSDANLTGANLKNTILEQAIVADKWKLVWQIINQEASNINLSSLDLSGANFSNISLDGVNFSQTNLKLANLSKANLSKANLVGANLENANLKGAKLELANLSGVKINDQTVFSRKWRLVWTLVNEGGSGKQLQNVNLKKANLSSANLGSINLSGSDLSEANLSGTNLNYANLEKVNLQNANLEGANLLNANIKDVNFEGANLKGAIMPDGSKQ